VPVIYVSKRADQATITQGKLADIAPTLLTLMDITPPEAMDGNNIVTFPKG